MKKGKFILKIMLLVVTLIAVFYPTIYATVSSNTTLQLVEEPVCNIDFGSSGKFEKKLIDFDSKKRYATLQLKVTNNSKASSLPGEIVFVIDNSDSMTDEVAAGLTRRQVILDSTEKLIDQLQTAKSDIKIGIVEFASAKDVEKEGSLEDAVVRSELTSDKAKIAAAFKEISENSYGTNNTQGMGPRTDIEAGLELGQGLFTKNSTNKQYLILLTDGVPNLAIGVPTDPQYSDKVIVPTSKKLTEIKTNGFDIISLMIGLNLDYEIPGVNPVKTYKDVAESIFGKADAPTAGSISYVPNTETDIETEIIQNIFASLTDSSSGVLTNIKIKDYFPKEIIENFNFEHVKSPDIGTVSSKVDTTDNSITWTIDKLEPGQTATLSYKLTLKDNFNSSILGQIIPTNKEVDITYTEDGKNGNEKSNVSPKVTIDSTPTGKIPQTGSTTVIITASIISGVLLILVIALVILKRNKDIK